jgi:hypothetical protein
MLSNRHGDDGGGLPELVDDELRNSYANLEDHRALLRGHICLMILGWVILLPLGTCEGTRLRLIHAACVKWGCVLTPLAAAM